MPEQFSVDTYPDGWEIRPMSNGGLLILEKSTGYLIRSEFNHTGAGHQDVLGRLVRAMLEGGSEQAGRAQGGRGAEPIGFIPCSGLNNLAFGHPAKIYPVSATPSPFESHSLLYTQPAQQGSVPADGQWLIQMRGDYLTTRGVWERPDHRGYTNDINEAGRYSEAVAKEAERMMPEKCKAVRLPAIYPQPAQQGAFVKKRPAMPLRDCPAIEYQKPYPAERTGDCDE